MKNATQSPLLPPEPPAKLLPNFIIEIGDYHAVVPQCCEEWANLGIFHKDPFHRYQPGGNAYHKVSVPELRREWSLNKAWDMPVDDYDRIVHTFRHEILALIERLISM